MLYVIDEVISLCFMVERSSNCGITISCLPVWCVLGIVLAPPLHPWAFEKEVLAKAQIVIDK